MLRRVLAETPGATLAFVGDGPERAMLEEHLAGLPVTFMVRDTNRADCLDLDVGCSAHWARRFYGLEAARVAGKCLPPPVPPPAGL